MGDDNPPPSPTARIFKAVGYATALLTLAFGVSRVWIVVTDYGERQRQVEELLATADVQLIGADYPDAWESVSAADAIQPSERVRMRLEDVAMVWLRDLRVPSGQTFSDVVSPLLPVVTRGVTESEGARQADLLAHVGWANFQGSRDGFDSDFERYYEEALAIDPGNPFANAFLGHWILWRRGSAAEATAYFAAGLESGREQSFIRQLQLAGLTNVGSIENSVELVRMAVEIVRSDESPPDGFAERSWSSVYRLAWSNSLELVQQSVLDAVAPQDHVAVFERLFGPDSAAYRENRWERDLWLAHILERGGAAGRAATLLGQTLRTASSGAALNSAYLEQIDAAIARLSGGVGAIR